MGNKTILETRDLVMRFGGVTAVDKVNFKLREGELRCLIGPNGAGKSTFFKCLTGIYKPTFGEILVRGKNIIGLETHAIMRMGIGVKTQVPNVFDGLSVKDNIMLSARRGRSKSQATSLTDDILNRLKLKYLSNSLVGQLAHGQRQWIELGIVLASEPKLILLDEPVAGLSNDEIEKTAELIREINQTASVIVVDHDMQFIKMIADEVTVFHQGAVLLEGNIKKILHNSVVRDVYLGKQVVA